MHYLKGAGCVEQVLFLYAYIFPTLTVSAHLDGVDFVRYCYFKRGQNCIVYYYSYYYYYYLYTYSSAKMIKSPTE